jgi:hypothetical protein
MDLMGEPHEGLDVTLEVTPRKVKGRRELQNLECSINYNTKSASTRRGEASLLFSSVGDLWVLGFAVLWVLGLRAY